MVMARAQVLTRVKFLCSSYKPAGSCQILICMAAAKAAFPLRGGCAEILKKLEIYDIIKGGPFGPAQIQLMSNFAFRANL